MAAAASFAVEAVACWKSNFSGSSSAWKVRRHCGGDGGDY